MVVAAALLVAAAKPTIRAAEDGGQCRTFATQMTRQTAGSTQVTTITCDFSRAALTYTCVTQAGGQRSTSTTAYNTLTDFIGEVSVIPPLTRAYSTSFATADGRSGSGVLEHDAHGRLLRQTTTLSSGSVQTDSYSAWDAAGRPTHMEWTESSKGGAFDIVYDDATLTTRFVPLTSGGLTCELTYNSYGEMVSNVCRGGSSTAASTWTFLETRRVCR
jgi:hypothetical protein